MYRLLLALSFSLLVSGVARADGEHSPPFCMDWDWTTHKRKIHFWVSPEVDDCELTFLNRSDPPGLGGAGFSLGDAARYAAGVWSMSGVDWEFCEVGTEEEACLKILKEDLGAPPPPPEPLLPIDGGAGGMGALAVFRQVEYDDMNELTIGEIVYNQNIPIADWGITPGGDTIDPILVMLHEFGHAIRLKDQTGAIEDCMAGHIMRGALVRGAHRWNKPMGGPDPLSRRNPSTGDLCEANDSAASMAWVPALPVGATLGMVVAALLVGALLVRQRPMGGP